MSRHSILPPIEERGMYYGKFIRVMKNGDEFYPGTKVLINDRDVKSFEKLLDTLNDKMKPVNAIRNLYTPENGTRITRIDDIEEDKIYVAAANDRFRRLRNTNSPDDREIPHGKIIRVSMDGAVDAKPTKVVVNPITMRTFDDILEEVGRMLKAQAAVRALFTPEHGTRIRKFEQLQDDHEYLAGTVTKFKGRSYLQRMRNRPPSGDIELPQGKLIHVYLDGDPFSKPQRVLINPRNMKTFDRCLEEISRVLKPQQAIRAIFTPEHGSRVREIEALRDDHIYVAGTSSVFKGHEYRQRIRELPSLADDKQLPQGRIVHFLLDGDPYAKPIRYLINHRTPDSYTDFLDDITKKLKSPAPIRNVFTPESGTRVTLMQQLQDDHMYIAGDGNRMKGFGEQTDRYTSIEQGSPRRHGRPKTYQFLDIEPVNHSKKYQAASGRIRHIITKGKIVHVCINNDETNGSHVISIPSRKLNAMKEVIDVVDNYLNRECNILYRVEYLVDKDTGDLISDPNSLDESHVYVACNKYNPYKPKLYSMHPRANFSIQSPRGAQKTKYLWKERSNVNGTKEMKRPRTLPPINPKGYKHGSPDNSVASNPEYKRRNQSREPNGVFHAKPVKHKRTPEKQGRNDYDRDDGVFKAKGQSKDTRGAKEVGDSRDTRTDLPIDQVQAEEVKEDTTFSDDRDADLPSEVSLSKKPSDPKSEDNFDDFDDENEEDEKIKGQSKNNNNAKETTQKTETKKHGDHSHGRKPSPPPAQDQHKHSGTRGEFNNTSPLPNIQAQNDNRTSTAKDRGTPDAGKKKDDDAEMKKKHEAATKIQAGVRGHQVRKEVEKKKQDQTKDDVKVKEDNASKQKEQDKKKQEKKEEEAATKIQAGVRGYQTRKELKKQKEEKEVNDAKGYSSGRSRDTLGNDEEEAAATKIQANFRGHKARKELKEQKEKKEEEQAATKIQANFRGHQARKEVDKMKEEEKAATKIQAQYRGYKTRKELNAEKEEEVQGNAQNPPATQGKNNTTGDQNNASQGNTQANTESNGYS